MRIAFYTPRALHLDLTLYAGGDPVFLHSLFAALRARGHEIAVVSRLDIRDLWRGRVSVRRFLREALESRRRVKRFSPDAWLVFRSSRTYPDLLGWWQRPRRYVLLFAHTWQSKKLPRFWKRLFAVVFSLNLRRADRVIVDRLAIGERLRRRGVPSDRLAFLPYAVQWPDEVPTQSEARKRLGLPADRPVILGATRLPELSTNGLKTEMFLDLLRVFAAMRSDALLVLVGDGEGRTHVDRAVQDLALDERVRLAGAVDNDEMTSFYAACDVYVYPNPLDRPWMSVLEAQACGRPVVTMRTQSAELTVDEGKTGLLADDLDQFRAELEALVADRARCESMGRAARRFIADRHSTEAFARQLDDWLGADA
jgi:glycosyltransferase involved in cell wall biosynthesis